MKYKYFVGIVAAIALAGFFAIDQLQITSTPPAQTSIASVTNAATSTRDKAIQVTPAPRHVAAPAAVIAVSTAAPTQARIATSSPTPTPNVTFSIASTSYGIYAPMGTTVLDAMRTLASTSNFSFTGREYPSLGFFVDSINGKNNADGNYWFLYVNGRSSDTGASQTTLNAGDTIEWRYERNH